MSISLLDSVFWFTGHILMHCSTVPSMLDILQTPPCNMFENPWIIFILTVFNCTPTTTLCWLPPAAAKGYSSDTGLEAPHTRPPPTLLSRWDRREYLGIFLFQPFILALSRPPGAQSRVESGQQKRKRTRYSESCVLSCKWRVREC